MKGVTWRLTFVVDVGADENITMDLRYVFVTIFGQGLGLQTSTGAHDSLYQETNY